MQNFIFMPFTKPYKNRYEQGDLVYGLSEVRDLYAKNMELFYLAKTPEYIATIDQYVSTPLERKDQHLHDRKKPDNLDDFLAILKEHPKYKSVYVSNKGFYLEGSKVISCPDDMRRKCKAGLYWAACSTGRVSIHFLLDLLNLEEVILKSNHNDTSESISHKARSFTGAELRWIYRNRHNSDVLKAIQFWYNGKPCCPPWVAGFDALYQEKIAYKWSRYLTRHNDF